MGQDIFLARSEEQRQFRRSLMALIPSWPQRNLPTLGKLLPQRDATPEPEPSVLLFYGPGGMGKTTLTRRLHSLAQSESPFKGQVNTLFLDWEQEQKLTVDLQVGHANISPDTVLRVLHKSLTKAFSGNGFGDYEKALKELNRTEEKVTEAMQGQPDTSLPDQVSKLGAKGMAYLIRMYVGMATVPQEPLETTLDTTFKVSAEGLYQTRQFVQRALTPQEYALYEQPNERLAEALGRGIARLSQRKPLVLLFDTYEIVDRPECDYTLRRVIQTSGDQTLWAIGGRSNLSDSGQRGKVYFRGYKRDFTENQIYAKALSEFGLELIQQYFAQVTPDQPISEEQADAVARFSLGIPFVIRQAAVMWREGKPIEDIVAPTPPLALGSGVSSYDQVITTTSERFLVHCFGAPEQEADLEAIYALALMRRPDADLLRQMLDETDLEARLQRLKERYGFIWVEQLRLDEKLTQFLRAYLLPDLRRTSQRVQTLNDRALAWLELQVEEKGRGIADTAEKLEEETLAETLLDLAHHQFWQGEDAGMRYLVPRFVEGWQYDRDWTRSLLEIAESFSLCLGKDSQKRLTRFENVLGYYPDLDDLVAVLADLEKLKQRGRLGVGNEAEQETILWLRKGQLAYRQERYADALECYLTAEKHLPTDFSQLQKDLADGFYGVSSRFIWPDYRENSIYSIEGEKAAEKAVELDPSNGSYHYNLGVVRDDSGRYDEAIAAYKKAIEIEPRATRYNGLGIVYSDQGRYEEAIASYQTAIDLDPEYAYAHHGLGIVYREQGRYEEAIAAYQAAIDLDPKVAYPHNSLGIAYLQTQQLEQATTSFRKAIEIESANYMALFNLGLALRLQKKLHEAQQQWELSFQAISGQSVYDQRDQINRALLEIILGSREAGFRNLNQAIRRSQQS
ncbi:MAG: tetratricopeptide repeat protein, partial [Leptolyngbya sp. DLM2.Bin15]